jgi:ribonuclease BN (tRNA processing enzyme)
VSKDVKLTMVGTGGALGYKYYTNSCLVETEGYSLLIDCGETTPLGLHAMGYDLSKLDGIFITHIHGDHVNGLEKLAWTMRYILKRKIDLIGDAMLLNQLWEQTLRGGLEDAEEGTLTLDDLFNVIPMEPLYNPDVKSFHDNGTIWKRLELAPSLRLEMIRTQHIRGKASYSVFINDNIFYSGDVRFMPELFDYLTIERGVGVIFHDVSFHDESIVHAPLAKLLTLDEDLQRSIWLMHYGDNMEDFIGKTGKMRFLSQGITYIYREDERFLQPEV